MQGSSEEFWVMFYADDKNTVPVSFPLQYQIPELISLQRGKFIWLTVLETPVWSLGLLLWADGHYQDKEKKELKARVSFKSVPPNPSDPRPPPGLHFSQAPSTTHSSTSGGANLEHTGLWEDMTPKSSHT